MTDTLAASMGKQRATEIKQKLKASTDCEMTDVLEFLVDGMVILIARENSNGHCEQPKRLVTIGRWIRIENFGGLHVAVIILALAVGGVWAKDIVAWFLK